RDLLQSGSVAIANKLEAAGVEVTLRVWEDLWHVFEFYPELPEAQASINEIVAHLKSQLFR
ncbi:MAG: alpha/beta hydrolase, partial [Pseudomonadota bacterium]